MRSAVAVAAAAMAALLSPARAPGQAGPNAGAAAAVRDRLAEAWGVDAATVVVELAPARGAWPPAGAREMTLLGSGTGVEWVVKSDVPGDPGVRARAGVVVEVPVAARALPRGHELATSDMVRGEEVRWGPPTDAGAVAAPGWRTLRPVAEGEALRPPAVQPPLAVQPGDRVDVLWLRGRVAVKTAGTAAGAAPVGGEVTVRTEKGRRLTGVVVAPGVVDVSKRGGG